MSTARLHRIEDPPPDEGLQRPQPLMERRRVRKRLLVNRRVGGQQQLGPQLQQPGRHHHPVRLLTERDLARLLQGLDELVDQSADRNTFQVDPPRPGQQEQLLERAGEPSQSEGGRCFAPWFLLRLARPGALA